MHTLLAVDLLGRLVLLLADDLSTSFFNYFTKCNWYMTGLRRPQFNQTQFKMSINK